MLHVLRSPNQFDEADHQFVALLESGEVRHKEAVLAAKKSTNRAARSSYLSHIDTPHMGPRLERNGMPLHRVAMLAWAFRRGLAEVTTASIRAQDDSITLKNYRIAKYGTDGIAPLEHILRQAPTSSMGPAELFNYIKDWTEMGGIESRSRRGQEKPLTEWVTKRADWTSTSDVQRPWHARVGECLWQIRINDFPDEPLFTLMIDGAVIGDLEDWPKAWKRHRTNRAGEKESAS
ncbi:MAG: hypothetical protein J0H49_16905 [Acidobacteria bacterium]|nr:hypothetical protein [Acidobacteriota bacterium]